MNFPYFMHEYFGNCQKFIKSDERLTGSEKKYFCAFVVGDSKWSHRIEFCQALSKYKPVHCYGAVLNNRKIPPELLEKHPGALVLDSNRVTGFKVNSVPKLNALNQALFKDYKFVICFENSIADDYITEKLPNVLLGGSIAIYSGAENVHQYFNTKAFVNLHDCGTYQNMIQKVIELDQDDDAYDAMLNQSFFVNNTIPAKIIDIEKNMYDFMEKLFVYEG